jgi:hypothetical protein
MDRFMQTHVGNKLLALIYEKDSCKSTFTLSCWHNEMKRFMQIHICTKLWALTNGDS